MKTSRKSSTNSTRNSNSDFSAVEAVLSLLSERYRESLVERIGRGSPFRVLLATILSQRTRDETTEKVAEAFFERYGSIEEVAEADVSDIASVIKPAGFSKQKAHNLKACATAILTRFGGRVPDDEESLLRLPGVGQKTAGCVLVYAFGKPALPVDTHVHRIANRLGWVETKTPEQTAKELRELLPKEFWLPINRVFVMFGREICQPRRPKCSVCPIKRWCVPKRDDYSMKTPNSMET